MLKTALATKRRSRKSYFRAPPRTFSLKNEPFDLFFIFFAK